MISSAVGNSDSKEELVASMTSLLFDRHFRKLRASFFHNRLRGLADFDGFLDILSSGKKVVNIQTFSQ